MSGARFGFLEGIIFTVALFGVLVPSCWAINCYKCKSEDSKACNAKTPAGEAIPAVNCSNPNKMLNDWLGSHDFMKKGVGDIDLNKLLNAAEDETTKGTELKNVTACAYLFASSENVVTKTVDEGIQKARSFFGDEKADEGVTVQTWAMRDCVTVISKEEETAREVNRCVPVPGTKDIAKLQFCTCTEDKCNYPTEKMKGFIADSTKSTGGKVGGGGLTTPTGAVLLALGIFAKMMEN